MYGRPNFYFPHQNALPTEENGTSGRNSARGGGGEHRVIRSEVWSRFRLEGLNAVCLVCNEKLKVGPTRQTSSLWRHLKRHNRMIAQGQRIPRGDYQHQQQQSSLYFHHQQQAQLLRRSSSNGLTALGGGGGIGQPQQQQQQQNAFLSHGQRTSLALQHHFRLQQQQGIRMPSSSTTTALLHNNFRQQMHHQQQNHRHMQPFSASSCSAAVLDQLQKQQPIAASPPPATVDAANIPPLVTVDCKPVKSRELDQLLGICREEEEEEEEEEGRQHEGTTSSSRRGTTEENELIMLNDDDRQEEEAVDNGGIMEEEEEEEEGGDEDGTMGREWQLACTLTEFILENELAFHRLLSSATFSSFLRLNQSVPKSLPSAPFLLQRIVPKLFADTLEERKTHFNDDFFVLTLNKIELDRPKQTALLCVSAQKLSDCFALCARSLGQFAFDCADPSGMSNALRHCFEEGPVRLHLWQISAIVHDGGADSEELCQQLDVPGVPSVHSLIRHTFAELDKLKFPAEFVARLKKRFETTVDEILNGNWLTDAFSILVPPLIDRIDRFFREEEEEGQTAASAVVADAEEGPAEINGEKKCGASAPIPIHQIEQRLLTKFQLLWAFQRRKLAELETAMKALFLNPSNLCGRTKRAAAGEGGGDQPQQQQSGQEFFGESKWEETAERVREQISQVCEDGEENDGVEEVDKTKTALLREDIQSEVTNYMDTARLELGHSSATNNGIAPSPSLTAHFNTLAELLFWWRINAERFPRLVQLARQFCAIPINIGDRWNSVMEDDESGEEETKTRRYAAELMATDGDIAMLESGRTEQLHLLTQLMTIRMALRERLKDVNVLQNGTKERPNTNILEPSDETPRI